MIFFEVATRILILMSLDCLVLFVDVTCDALIGLSVLFDWDG